VIAVDTNILVYAHRAEMPFHRKAKSIVESLAHSAALWAIPWPCLHEFIAIITNPRIFKTPTTLPDAFDVVCSFAGLHNLSLLSEGDGYLEKLQAFALPAKLQGGAIHDARIAAICAYHGVTQLWSSDRDFSRFPALVVNNPLTQ
jgi:toxin-antitoxin system PIN domain toxin